jgi:hypothetical protein
MQDGLRGLPFLDQAIGVRQGAEGARVEEYKMAVRGGTRRLLPTSALRIEQP